MDVARACVERTGPPPGGFLLAFFGQGHVVGHVGELVFQPLLERVVSRNDILEQNSHLLNVI
ncbi:hypothetical protein PMIT1306_00220 [Prochlorococcus sp. MIT 1306]|nr:hypothetical protein PMIT1306_00220 [Prochlorococcus sp. MIT 1306]